MSELEDREKFRGLMGFSENMYDDTNDGEPLYIPAKRPPMVKELDNAWNVNHKEPPSNLISNTYDGATGYRVTEAPEVSLREYTQYYNNLFMKEKSAGAVRQALHKVPANILRKTASIWQSLSKERGLIGEYYVKIGSFKDCHAADAFFKQHCKTAKFIQKETKCGGCKFNEGDRCGLMKKHLAEHIPYTNEIASALVKKAQSENWLNTEALSKVASYKDPKKKIQSIFLYKQAGKTANEIAGIQEKRGGILEAEAFKKYKADTDKDIVRILTAAIKKGASYEKIFNKVASHLGSTKVKSLMVQAVKGINPINTVAFMNCSDSLKGKVSLLIKDASCSGCVFYGGDQCNKYKVSFVNPKKDDVVTSISAKVKDAQIKNADHMVDYFAKCINSGIAHSQLKTAFVKRIPTQTLNTYVAKALQKATKVSAYNFCRCTDAPLEKVAKLYRDENCTGCYFNANTQCNKLKKAFVNPEHIDKTGYTVTETDLPMVNDHPDIKKASRLLEKNVSEQVALKVLAAKGATGNHITDSMKTAIQRQGYLDAVNWNGCKKTAYVEAAPALLKTETCTGCNDNQGMKCSRLSKDFVNASDYTEQESNEVVNAGYDQMEYFK